MKFTPFLCLGLVAGVGALRAQPQSDDEKALWQAEQAWNQAYVRGDAAAVEAAEAKGYVSTEADGKVHTREDELKDLKDGTRFTEMSLHEEAAHLTGDTAVVTARSVTSGHGEEGSFSEISEETDTFAKVNGAWLAVSSHETKLADSDDSAITPLWRDGNGHWLDRHAGFVADAKKGGVDLLFVGDSITDFWRLESRGKAGRAGKAVWDKYYGSRHAANIGISGDRTQHVLWRLQQGEVDGLRPKAVVLMIGTNNTGLEADRLTPRNTPAEAAEGVAAVVNELRRRLPEAKILLLAVFPRGHTPDDPQRLQVAAINKVIQGLADGDHVHFLDIGAKFLAPDGTLSSEIFPDFLHPNEKGYEIWAQAIEPTLAGLLGSGR